MRIVTLLSWTAIMVGAVGIVAGRAFEVPKGLHFGAFLIGAGFALRGLESVVTRRMSFRFSASLTPRFHGGPAGS